MVRMPSEDSARISSSTSSVLQLRCSAHGGGDTTQALGVGRAGAMVWAVTPRGP
ncbi:MAG: hypothetical protein V5B44_05060 [Candidatus Accumulibacter necessarius]